MRQPVRGVTPTNLIGEKRRRQVSQMDADKTDSDALNDSETEQSPIASRTRSTLTIGGEAELPISADLPRSVLTARRTRVRVLYHDPSPQHGAIPLHMRSGMPVQFGGEGSAGPVALGESPPNNPLRKRGRHSDRPSLNFDKMREVRFQRSLRVANLSILAHDERLLVLRVLSVTIAKVRPTKRPPM